LATAEGTDLVVPGVGATMGLPVTDVGLVVIGVE
jgi:hypothetical protein